MSNNNFSFNSEPTKLDYTYCQQVSKEEMDQISKEKTAIEMFKLGAGIKEKLDQKERDNQTKNLRKLESQMELSSLLNEYFELDETQQKARMLELFTKLTKLEKKNNEISNLVDDLDKDLQNEKDRADELDQQLEQYIEDLEKSENKLKKTLHELKTLKQLHTDLKRESKSALTEKESYKWYYNFMLGMAYVYVPLTTYFTYYYFNSDPSC